MYAAREGNSTLGIAKSVGEEFVGKDDAETLGEDAGDWTESDHPRDESGKFAKGGGGSISEHRDERAAPPDAQKIVERNFTTGDPYSSKTKLIAEGGKNEIAIPVGITPEGKRLALINGKLHMGPFEPSKKDPMRPLSNEQVEELKAAALSNLRAIHEDAERQRTRFEKPARELASDLSDHGYQVKMVHPDDTSSRYLYVTGENGTIKVRLADHAQPTEGGKVVGGFSSKTGKRHESSDYSIDPSNQNTAEGAAEFVKTHLKPFDVKESEHAADSIAFDRASVRRIDQDGHLFVETTPISKANVCPYYGREIPDHDKLGLDPDRIYQLYRHPDELKTAAGSFAGKPLLNLHTPVGADDHPTDAVVGAVGDKVEFKPPYLMAPLRVWDGDAIDQIQSGAQKELSCGYRYRADMTPGEHQGQKYDGVMRDIVGNHVALVEEGRAGPDVVVGDQAMKRNWKRLFALDESEEAKERARGKFSEKDKETASEHVKHREDMPASAFLEPQSRKYPVKEKKDGEWKYDRDLLLAAAREARMHGHTDLAARADAIRKREFGSANDRKDPFMGKKLLTRKAALAQGAVMAYLAPKLAQDAKVDLAPIFRGITAKNFKAKRDGIVSALHKAIDGKLAKDASLEDVTGLLDALEDCTPAEDDANNGVPNMAVRGEDEEPDQKSKVKEFLKGKLSEDDMEALDALFDDDDQEAMDESEEDKKENEREGENLKEREDKEKAEDEEQKDMVDKKAMDAAIKTAVAKERQTARDIETAKEDVRPYIGKVSIACDSAADVYKIALDAMKVDVRDVPPVAYKAILKAQPVPRTDRPAVSMAADAKGAKSFAERFPSAARITAA